MSESCSDISDLLANSSGKSAKLVVSQIGGISNNVRQKLRGLFFSSRIKKPAIQESAQTEIIHRWFEQNQDKVHWIDVNHVADLKDCLRLIEQYKNEELEMNERVIYLR